VKGQVEDLQVFKGVIEEAARDLDLDLFKVDLVVLPCQPIFFGPVLGVLHDLVQEQDLFPFT